jgi:hypothetical protein
MLCYLILAGSFDGLPSGKLLPVLSGISLGLACGVRTSVLWVDGLVALLGVLLCSQGWIVEVECVLEPGHIYLGTVEVASEDEGRGSMECSMLRIASGFEGHWIVGELAGGLR